MVFSYICQRISHYQNELNKALDQDDYQYAAKCRAIYVELKHILNSYQLPRKDDNEIFKVEDYYSTMEAAVFLDIHQTTVTRSAKKLGGVKYKGKWYFNKGNLISLAPAYQNKIRRGRRRDDAKKD